MLASCGVMLAYDIILLVNAFTMLVLYGLILSSLLIYWVVMVSGWVVKGVMVPIWDEMGRYDVEMGGYAMVS